MRRLYYRLMFRLTGKTAYAAKYIGLNTQKNGKRIAKSMKRLASE